MFFLFVCVCYCYLLFVVNLGCLSSSELYASDDTKGRLPEDIAKECAALLCEQIGQDACVDTVKQS